MKKFLKYSLIGIACYILCGAIFYGYHAYMLPLYLVLTGFISYFMLKKVEASEVRKRLIMMHLPILSLLVISALFLDSIRFILPYLLFIPIGAIISYGFISYSKKIIYLSAFILCLVSFNLISGSNETFNHIFLSLK